MRRFARAVALVLAVLLVLLTFGPFLVPVYPYQGRTQEELADPDSRFIAVRGLQFHYKMYGKGEPLFLLLHGFGSSTFTWDRVAPTLAGLGTVVAYDRPGFGLSQRPLRPDWPGYNPYDATEQAQLALELMHALGFEKAVLIGNSAGGGVALDMALKDPQAVQAMVLVSPAVSGGSRSNPLVDWLIHTPQVQHLGPLFVGALVPRLQSAIATAWHDPASMPSDVVPAYRKPLTASNWDAGLWYVTSAPGQLDLWGQVGSIQNPTLIVHGDDDRIIPQSDSRRLVSLNSHFTFVPLAGLGHVPQEEGPQTFLDVVLPWLTKIPGLVPAVSAP
ncbi:MAG: alpha/beta hydrolase [Caldiserica bacterium]|nr:alpha/beta hydrolase [Caldisericota bacterium]